MSTRNCKFLDMNFSDDDSSDNIKIKMFACHLLGKFNYESKPVIFPKKDLNCFSSMDILDTSDSDVDKTLKKFYKIADKIMSGEKDASSVLLKFLLNLLQFENHHRN